MLGTIGSVKHKRTSGGAFQKLCENVCVHSCVMELMKTSTSTTAESFGAGMNADYRWFYLIFVVQ